MPGREHGGLPILDLVAATFVAVVVALCFGWSHTPAPSGTHVVTLTTATPTIAIPQAASVPVPVASIPPAPAPGAIGTALTVTKAPGGPDVVVEALPNDPAVQLTCEVWSPGTAEGNATNVAGWYVGSIPSDIATLNPDVVRNCTVDPAR